VEWVVGAFIILIGVVMLIAGNKGQANQLLPAIFGTPGSTAAAGATTDAAITTALQGSSTPASDSNTVGTWGGLTP
jgi:hypothetical protein